MNYLFFLLGQEAFYESIIMSKLVDEMPLSAGIFCITGWIHSVYFSENERIYKLFLFPEAEENKKLIETILKEGEISAIFIFDFHKMFLSDNLVRKYLAPELIMNLSIPVNIIDYLDIFYYNEEGRLVLKNSGIYEDYSENQGAIAMDRLIKTVVKESNMAKLKPESLTELTYDKVEKIIYNIEHPENNEPEGIEENEISESETILKQDEPESSHLEKETESEIQTEEKENKDEEEKPADLVFGSNFSPNIIKLCPPVSASKDKKDKKHIYWNFAPKDFLSAEAEKMKLPLGIKEGRKSVMLIFSYQMILKSLLESKQEHYNLVMNSIVSHLKKLDIEINLFVIGFEGKNLDIEGSKVKVRAFSVYNHELYKTILSFSDLVITDTTWNPVLLDAAILKKPAAVIGNSLRAKEYGSFEADFESTSIDIFQDIEKRMKTSPQIFYPYSSFPLEDEKMPEFTFYDNVVPYYLLDFYSDESVVPFLGEFLTENNGEVSKNLNNVLDEYAERTKGSITTEEMLKLFTKK